MGGLAVSVAYFMTKAISIDGCDPIDTAAEQIRGYQLVNPLTPEEKDVLLDAIMGRLCSSYISGCHQANLDPGNAEYIFAQSKHIPKLFDIMGKYNHEEITKMLLQ